MARSVLALVAASGLTAPAAAARRPADVAEPGPRWTLNASVRCRRSPEKMPRTNFTGRQRRDCGEDAFFIAAPTAQEATVGIADGVGGWRASDIDPAFFAWCLMEHCHLVAEGAASGNDTRGAAEGGRLRTTRAGRATADAFWMLELGFKSMVAAGAPVGSSTACLASLDRHRGILRIANLGDSGALLLRGPKREIVLQTRPQQESFNVPYQLMQPPEGMTSLALHPPSAAETYEAEVQDGDVLVMATDGVFDNMGPTQVAELVAHLQDASADDIAERVLRDAYDVSIEEWRTQTPYGEAARTAGYPHFGGKQDDITVLVARMSLGGS